MVEIDYDELSDRTIDEIKETVEDNDVDLQQLLEAERNNKDRTTLKQWIQDRMDPTGQDEKEQVEETASAGGSGTRMTMGPLQRPKLTFLAGLVIGILLAGAATYSAVGAQPALSPTEAQDLAQDYIDDRVNGSAINLTLQDLEGTEYQDLYTGELVLTAPGGQQRSQTVYISKQSGLMFAGTTPVDLRSGELVGANATATSR